MLLSRRVAKFPFSSTDHSTQTWNAFFQALSVYKTCNFCWWPYKLWCLSFCWVFFVQPTCDVFNVHVHVRNVLVCRLQIKANVNWNLHLQSTHASFGAVGCLSSTAASIYLHCSRKLFLSTQNSCCHSIFVLSLLQTSDTHFSPFLSYISLSSSSSSFASFYENHIVRSFLFGLAYASATHTHIRNNSKLFNSFTISLVRRTHTKNALFPSASTQSIARQINCAARHDDVLQH